MLVGAVLQHLVGAKLTIALPDVPIKQHCFSVADTVSGRDGDFLVGNTAIHVTTAPSEGLLQKCKTNLNNSLRPLIITTRDGAGGADALAANAGIKDRVEVLEIDQFLITNVYEWSGFADDRQIANLRTLIEAYNKIIDTCETDSSLKIEMGN